jgi:DNA-binding FadR family transcriptional regulator
MLDKNKMRQHHLEVTYVLGRFMTEHFIRVYKAFDGDLTAAIVLGTAEVGEKAAEGFHRLAERGEHLPHARPCNAMSISQSTGIPRETVRRKIRQLVAKGWLRKAGPDKLIVTSLPGRHFAEFDLETLEHFYAAAREILQFVEKRSRS